MAIWQFGRIANGRRHFADIRKQRDALGINAALYVILENSSCFGLGNSPARGHRGVDGRTDPVR